MESNNHSHTSIENLIREYLHYKEQSQFYGKKRIDAEKEYNRLLTTYEGEAKHYSLLQADSIYRAFLEMQTYQEQCGHARELFTAAEQKLNDIGRILFEPTISAEIVMTPSINGEAYHRRSVRVTYHNGQVSIH